MLNSLLGVTANAHKLEPNTCVLTIGGGNKMLTKSTYRGKWHVALFGMQACFGALLTWFHYLSSLVNHASSLVKIRNLPHACVLSNPARRTTSIPNRLPNAVGTPGYMSIPPRGTCKVVVSSKPAPVYHCCCSYPTCRSCLHSIRACCMTLNPHDTVQGVPRHSQCVICTACVTCTALMMQMWCWQQLHRD